MHALASHLRCTVGHLEQSMSAREFMEWQAWMANEQVGPFWDRLRHAEVMAAVHNGACERKGGGSFTFKDFMPEQQAVQRPPQTAQQLQAELSAWEASWHGA